MSTEGLSETAEEAHPDNIAQRPASNLLLAGTGRSLALAVSGRDVVVENNERRCPRPVAAAKSGGPGCGQPDRPGPKPAAESPGGPLSLSPSAMTALPMAPFDMAPDMAPLPMDQISVGQLTVDEMPAASPELNSRPRQQPDRRHSAASEGVARLGKFEEPDRPRPLDQPELRRSPGKCR